MGIGLYLKSILSYKKLRFKGVSLFSLWDNETEFTSTTHVLRGVRMTNVKIGRYSRIGVDTKVTNAKIGNFTFIGAQCVIGVGQHPTNLLTSHSIFYKLGNWGFHDDWVKFPKGFVEQKEIIIGNDVWIGRNVIIMDGVKIGDGAIIATGAIVTKDVPPFALVGGIPAKVIKYKFPQNMIDKLLEVKWWNLSDYEITKRIDLFHIENPQKEDLDKYFK